MFLTEIELKNFRGFDTFSINLERQMTVLVGGNAVGKTAILEGISVALGGYLACLSVETSRNIQREDVRQVCYRYGDTLDLQAQWPVQVRATGRESGEPLAWTRSKGNLAGHTTLAKEMKAFGTRIKQQVSSGVPIDLPVIATYGTQRVWLQKSATAAKRGVGSRWDGYIDALDPASNHRVLAEWMYQQTLAELQAGNTFRQLANIERAVCSCVQGATRFLFNIKSQSLELHFGPDKAVPFSLLSNGYINVVALVADLAWRAGVLNPHLSEDSASKSSGIVLIDEVELHLHPRWQRKILGDLKRAFPLLQFVVTTHSPQIVADVARAEIRLLGPGERLTDSPYVEGRDSNVLLEDVFGVDERPEWMRDRIEALSVLIESEDTRAARIQLNHLEQLLGPDDPAAVRARFELDLADAAAN